MKKNKVRFYTIILFIIFFTSAILSGCSLSRFKFTDKITSPNNKLSPINGVWEIKKFKVFNSGNKKYGESKTEPVDLLGIKSAFNEDYSLLIDEVCNKPNYKLKEVDANNYFFYTYKVNKSDLDISVDKIEVISVICEESLFYDFIKISDKELIVYLDNVFYYLEKISDDTSDILSEENLRKIREEKVSSHYGDDKLLRTGVLIGLRSNSPIDYKEGFGEEYKDKDLFYRTLWIGAKNGKLREVLETPNLFVPRISGFWWVGLDNQDSVFAYPVSKEIKDFNSVKWAEKNSSKRILFVGNDYIALENKKSLNLQSEEGRSNLQVRLIDNLNGNKGIKISDISGEEGKEAMFNSAYSFLALEDGITGKRLEQRPREESFTLVRRNGHWIVKGRLNSINQNDSFFKDYTINIVPPSKMVNYDEFHLSWNEVKEKVPNAIDAYTSPNKDLAIITSNNSLFIYEIVNGALGNLYLKKISLKEGESVIMAEWATGEYMERWEKTLRGNADVFVYE
ncbi:lipoprotein [Clostridium malenominatum]|uniref:Lipoprotein n=1 Tax=Clostridium malenominatum TaxID=1539 RepID=A0ABN1J0U6_9CLOT